MKNVIKLSERELSSGNKTSWHDQYRNSSWVFVGGLPYDLSEGDIICVFSQYGEIVNINLIRDKKTGKQKGFCFLCYEDQRSTVLAVDNLNGIKVIIFIKKDIPQLFTIFFFLL
jgi:RNA-binding motif X-linked protein 2